MKPFRDIDLLMQQLKDEGFEDLTITLRLIETSIHQLENGEYDPSLNVKEGKKQLLNETDDMLKVISGNIRQGLTRKTDKLMIDYFTYLKTRIKNIPE